MFERILVPLDGSKAAEIVFPYVTEMTSTFNSRIYLARVCESASQVIMKDCLAYLDGTTIQMKGGMQDWGSRSDVGVETKVLMGNTALEILKYASEIKCGLIAVASHGASGTGPWTLGNVAAKILRASNIPVLLVRKPAPNSRLIEKKLIKRILVTLDGSKLGEAAIPLVTELAQKTGAEIILFRSVEPIGAIAGPSGEIAWNFVSSYEKNARYPVMAYLERIRESLEKTLPNISTAIGDGLPADQIIEYAQTNNIDLIAMSTHGRSGIGRWVYGSVAEKVLHAGETPVLVVQPKPESIAR